MLAATYNPDAVLHTELFVVIWQNIHLALLMVIPPRRFRFQP